MSKIDMNKEIVISEGVQVRMNLPEIEVSGEKGKISKKFHYKNVKIENKDNKIIISTKKADKQAKAMINTFVAHLKNMIKGVKEGYTYKLKICSGHFPMTVNQEGNKIVIKNFYGERVPRQAKIPDGVKVEIKKDEITLTGFNKEKLGEAATNLEKSTLVKERDRRKFQDGIFLISKAGKSL